VRLRTQVNLRDDIKVRSKILVDEFGWDKEVSKKIWAFGPDTMGPNIMCDITKGVQYLNEIKVGGCTQNRDACCSACTHVLLGNPACLSML